MIKRYLLFCMDQYYPGGGWNDFVESFDTIEAATANIQVHCDFWHIVDTQAPYGNKIVKSGRHD